MESSKLVLLVLAFPCLIFLGIRLYYSIIASIHVVLIKRAIKCLCWAYDGVKLSEDEALMFEMLRKLGKGEIKILADGSNEQGAYHESETKRPVFLIPRSRLFLNEVSLDFIAPFLASEMMDFVMGAETNEATLAGTIRHFESGIRAFVQMKKKGYNFKAHPELLAEWEEEASIYQEDRDAWLIRTRATIFRHYPELIHAPV